MHLAASEGIPRKSFFIRNNDNLDQLLQRFWENEKLPNKTRTTEEILCEWHFEKLTARNETGRYIEKHFRREGQNRLRGFIRRSKTMVWTVRATFQGTSRRETKYIIKLFIETSFRINMKKVAFTNLTSRIAKWNILTIQAGLSKYDFTNIFGILNNIITNPYFRVTCYKTNTP